MGENIFADESENFPPRFVTGVLRRYAEHVSFLDYGVVDLVSAANPRATMGSSEYKPISTTGLLNMV